MFSTCRVAPVMLFSDKTEQRSPLFISLRAGRSVVSHQMQERFAQWVHGVPIPTAFFEAAYLPEGTVSQGRGAREATRAAHSPTCTQLQNRP